jgi:hypothetical protein
MHDSMASTLQNAAREAQIPDLNSRAHHTVARAYLQFHNRDERARVSPNADQKAHSRNKDHQLPPIHVRESFHRQFALIRFLQNLCSFKNAAKMQQKCHAAKMACGQTPTTTQATD